jgi:hypothetical protein
MPYRTRPAAEPNILHSAFAIHHLDGPGQKQQFLEGARQPHRPGGACPSGWMSFRDARRKRARPTSARYARRITQRPGSPLSGRAQAGARPFEAHLRSLDHARRPAGDRIAAAAEAAGWRWHWGWQGAHQAEALAVLTPDLRP